MRTLALAALLLAGPALAAETPAEYKDLTPGRYLVKVGGMLCNLCARGLSEELAKLDEAASVRADFEKEELVLTVKKDKVLRIAVLRKAFHRAAKRINLGSELEVEGIRYLP